MALSKKQEVRHVRKLKKGDVKAFESLFLEYSNKVYALARKMHISHEEAEGLVQNLFLKVWEKRKDLDSDRSFNAYLLTIARSMVIKLYRRSSLKKGYEIYALGFLRSSTNDTEENIIYEDLTTVASEYLNKLPKKQKQVFILKNLENLSVEEIAEKLDLSKRTVENQIYRASKTLRNKFSNLHILCLIIALQAIG